MFTRTRAASAVLLAAVLAAGCGTDDPAPQPTPPATPPTLPVPPTPETPDPEPFAITGTVTGLAGTGLTLTSGGKTITISDNGTFTVASDLSEATAYNVAVATHPAGPHQYCSVANGAGTATAAVTNIAVSCVAAVKIAAQVTDAPIAHATVTVKVGDKFYTTIADENGMFSINIPALTEDGAKMVIAEATGADNQSHVNFANILGTLSAVVDSADANGEIDSSTNASVNVTNVSTARYVLVVQANNGEVPSTGTALQTAERSVSATEVMNLAAAIKLIVDKPDEFKLPDGKSSILEFVQDKDAVDAFIAAAPAGAIDQALTEILADTSLVPGYKEAEVPGVYFLIPAAQPGFLSPQGSALVLEEDGSGTFMTSGAGGFPATESLTWEVIEGVVKVTYDKPLVVASVASRSLEIATQEQYDQLGCMGVFQVNYQWAVSERDYTLVSSGALVDQVRTSTLSTYTFDPVSGLCGGVPTTVQLAPITEVSTGTTDVWKADALEFMPFVADELVGKTWGIDMMVPVGPYFGDAGPTTQFANMLVKFNADGSATTEGVATPTGIPFALEWQITEDGDLSLQYGDWTQDIRKLQVSGDAVKSVMFFQNAVSEDEFAYFNLAVKKSITFADTAAVAAFWTNDEGEYWNTYTNGWFQSAWNADGTPIYGAGALTFGWSFTETTAWNHQFFFEAWDYENDFAPLPEAIESRWDREMLWSVKSVEGAIEFEGPYVNGCYPSITCYRRQWIPMGTSDAGHTFMNETVWYSGDDGATWGLWIAPRITPAKEQEFPESQVGVSHFVK